MLIAYEACDFHLRRLPGLQLRLRLTRHTSFATSSLSFRQPNAPHMEQTPQIRVPQLSTALRLSGETKRRAQ
jgi:hypothetical protein